LLFLSSPVLAQGSLLKVDHVEFRYLGEVSLEQLSSGRAGQGFLLYYPSQHGHELPSLVVRLSKQPESEVAVAEVFGAPPGMSYVPVRISNNTVTLDQMLSPTITIQALGGWWMRDGLVNYNLDIQVNGPVYAMWGGGYDPESGPFGWTAGIKAGEPAASIEVRDPGLEGVPKWDLRSLLPSFPGEAYYRSNYAERKCKTPLEIDLGVSPLWPFVAWTGGYEQPNGALRPPIVVDWQKGKITHFSELVTVRNQNCSYSLYSITSLVPGEMNQPNFETPFAFYDLSGQGEGYPNLILRTERFPARDPWSIGLDLKAQRGQPVPKDFETVRYSWRNAVGDGFWDYQIEVLGFHPYTFTTPIAGERISIDAPAHEHFPQWVIEQNWPIATFIDTEGNSYKSSEGLYDWTPREVGIGYILGWEGASDPWAFSEIRDGFRGEYRFENNLPPRLYLSPIDNRLHLLDAEGGLWNIGESLVLREHNLGNGRHINGWTREHIASENAKELPASQPAMSIEVEEALYALAGHLIYSGPEGVELRQAAYQPSSFEILPPADKASWQLFQEQLAPYTHQRRNPKDLKSWLSHFPGKTLSVVGGQISDVRAISDGFRFVLDLQPGYRVQENDLFDTPAFEPGRYVVIYNGQFTVEPLTPPALSASLIDASLTQLEPGAIQVALRNDGLEDLSQATLELWATSPDRTTSVVVTQTVQLLAQEPITPTLLWAPVSSGNWLLIPKVRQPDGSLISGKSVSISISPSQTENPYNLFFGGVSPRRLPVILGGLITLAMLAALVFWYTWREPLTEK